MSLDLHGMNRHGMSRYHIGRRALLQGMAATGLAALLPAAWGLETHSFAPAEGEFPVNPQVWPAPAIARPEGSGGSVFDIFGNHWCLAKPDGHGHRPLLVLPAQAPERWLEDRVSTLPAERWEFVGADEFGYVWVASAARCLRLDPHTPEAGWTDLTADALQSSDERIVAMGVAPSGAIALAFDSGWVAEVDRVAQTTVKRTAAPRGVQELAPGKDGTIWLKTASRIYTMPAEPKAWQRQWELVDRLPAGNHDLSGDTVDGRFYMACGQNAGWGYPAKPHVFRELFEFDAAKKRWRVAARLDRPRFYNGTACLAGKVWVIGGYERDAIGNPVPLASVEIVDPATGAIALGPDLPVALHSPVALRVNGRIYMAGHDTNEPGDHPCKLFSIGAGERAWRAEPDGPEYFLALAGTVYEDDFYLAIPAKGLARFHTNERNWSMVPYPQSAGSPQMAVYDDEIWVMGGRDISNQARVVICNPKTGTWRNGPDLPRELAWGAGANVDRRLMVVGGAAGRSYNNRTFYLRPKALA